MIKLIAMKHVYLSLLCCLILGCVSQQTEITEKTITLGNKNLTISELGDNKFKIGSILVDKNNRKFEVSGRFIRSEPPIEFLAVAKDGGRAYESLLELDVNVYEFNLACILIGLDTHKGKSPTSHFDPEPIDGDAVEIWLSWEINGNTFTYEAADLFHLNEGKLNRGEWVYTGSDFLPEGQYLPEAEGGTLIGIVHDPASIIEHRVGVGGVGFSQTILNLDVLPAENTRVQVVFSYAGNTLNKKLF